MKNHTAVIAVALLLLVGCAPKGLTEKEDRILVENDIKFAYHTLLSNGCYPERLSRGDYTKYNVNLLLAAGCPPVVVQRWTEEDWEIALDLLQINDCNLREIEKNLDDYEFVEPEWWTDKDWDHFCVMLWLNDCEPPGAEYDLFLYKTPKESSKRYVLPEMF